VVKVTTGTVVLAGIINMASTPMMQQYLEIKANYPEALLMFRLGDFYELFLEDAVIASKILEITLTGREAGSLGRIPMCGVPHHAVQGYINRLVEVGHCVAICEQVEDPKLTKGLVKREVVQVITPGTAVLDEGGLGRYLAAAIVAEQICGLALIDVSTGDVLYGQYDSQSAALEALGQWSPKELIVTDKQDKIAEWANLEEWITTNGVRVTQGMPDSPEKRFRMVCQQYQASDVHELGMESSPLCVDALGLALLYVQSTQKLSLQHLRFPQNLMLPGHMVVDNTAQKHLELFETQRLRQRKGSLFGYLDKTKSAIGSRCLRRLLERPLQDVAQIDARLDAVAIFASDALLRLQMQECLAEVYDLDRLMGRLSFRTASPRDVLAISKSLAVIPTLCSLLAEGTSLLIQSLISDLPDLTSLRQMLLQTLIDNPASSVQGGGLIKEGADAQLDELRTLSVSAKVWLAELEQRERDETGIRTLKVGYNRVFGYYIEVSKANVHLVPAHYERRQTLASAERYVIPVLKERESQILNAEERRIERELELFQLLCIEVLNHTAQIQTATDILAMLDALVAIAMVSVDNRLVRPQLVTKRGIYIEEGRHPTVEMLAPGRFVPNDIQLSDEEQLMLITGPNMAGKSTVMRQTAIIVLLAHSGCFVPAKSAVIGLVDRLFTRIGASDDLGAGQSTFMVEMVELSLILHQATNRSLVLLDEIGRGTSTYDGLSIAQAVMEALTSKNRQPLTLFATHYHELTLVAEELPTAVNYSVLVREVGEQITFLHSLVKRSADKSYGIHVARLAGIPHEITERAQTLLRKREKLQVNDSLQTSLPGFASNLTHVPKYENFVERVSQLNAMQLTPLEAIARLHELILEAKEVSLWAISK